MPTAITSKQGAVWLQPGGANKPMYFIGCAELDTIEEPKGSINLIRCFNPSGEGWRTVATTEEPPDPITTTLTSLVFPGVGVLDKIYTNFGLYAFSRAAGRADNFSNYVRGSILANAKVASISRNSIAMRETDEETTREYSVEAEPPVIEIFDLSVARQVTTELLALNDVFYSDEGNDTLELGQDVIAGADGGAGSANFLITANGGSTWTAGAADPFAVGEHIFSIVKFFIDATTVRYLVARNGVAATPAEVAYSDDGGATWTAVTVGAVVLQGAVDSGALFVLNQFNIWFCATGGYIYFSSDGGETWTAQESGILTVNDLRGISFFDEDTGYCVGDVDTVLKTTDGGSTWQAASATGGGNDLLCVFALEDRIWIGDDAGSLWFSEDGGVTYTERTGWIGSGTGTIDDISFDSEYVGYMVHNVGGAGTIFVTVNGGFTWRRLTTPTNAGLNAISAVSENIAYAVGEVQGGTAVILKVSP